MYHSILKGRIPGCECAKALMQKAVAEVKALPDYKKKWRGMCVQFRYAFCLFNFLLSGTVGYTTVPCLSGRCFLLCDIPYLYWLTSQHQANPWLLYCVESRAQTREMACTQTVLQEVLSQGTLCD